MDWENDRDPALGDVTLESGSTRYFLVVGIEEHRYSPRVWWLTLERISIEDAVDRIRDGAESWPHIRYRRGERPPDRLPA